MNFPAKTGDVRSTGVAIDFELSLDIAVARDYEAVILPGLPPSVLKEPHETA